ncbi:fumarylacetoacetate hydrolase family protein [Sphingopyxis indica]|nr:fumarylacetoacetate hydrolase family protein [Sphingopyxis indica]WOF42432.1 fumarylacetoacetate hydrolase family protein [Sphingopyxis indica]
MERTDHCDRMVDIIVGFDRFRSEFDRARASLPSLPLSEAALDSPVMRPGKVVAMGSNYLEGTDGPPLPIWAFVKSPQSITGPGGTIRLPPVAAKVFHHETELVAVIGKTGKDIKAQDARSHVFGYMVGIDVSGRRDVLPQSLFNKSHDTFSPIGPVIATADEIPDPHRLGVRLWVDGELRQDFSTSDMGHNVWESISYVSSVTTLNPGDLIFTGTNHQGLGPLQDGEMVEAEIEGIGRLALRVSDPLKRSWPKGVDTEIGQRVLRMLREGKAVGSV